VKYRFSNGISEKRPKKPGLPTKEEWKPKEQSERGAGGKVKSAKKGLRWGGHSRNHLRSFTGTSGDVPH